MRRCLLALALAGCTHSFGVDEANEIATVLQEVTIEPGATRGNCGGGGTFELFPYQLGDQTFRLELTACASGDIASTAPPSALIAFIMAADEETTAHVSGTLDWSADGAFSIASSGRCEDVDLEITTKHESCLLGIAHCDTSWTAIGTACGIEIDMKCGFWGC